MKAHQQLVALVGRIAMTGVFEPAGNYETSRTRKYREPMKRAGFKVLGNGCYGMAFASPAISGCVVKVASDGDKGDAYGDWIDFVMEVGPTLPERLRRYLPRIYSAERICGVMVVVMESLTSAREAINEYLDDGNNSGAYKEHRSLRGCRDYPAYSDAVDLCNLMEAHNKALGSEKDKEWGAHCLDLHSGNVMFRDDGQMVVTDPWA